jgi:thiol peroxidase
MAVVTLGGNPVHTSGDLPAVGSVAPDFVLTRADLTDASLGDFSGKKKILNIVPSLDTGVCATSARTFNAWAAGLGNVVVITISNDLPFAQKRFCDANSIDVVETLAQMRDRKFGEDYGVELTDGPMAGLTARAIVVLDEDNVVLHTELVSEIGHEPDYDKALSAAE